MRFELVAAYVMGIALPLLEVLRRRTNFETISGYVDDFIAGGLLLYAARAVSRKEPRGPVLLVAAWAVLCGGLYGSFFHQLESGASHDVSGLANATVVLVKGVLYTVALVGLGLSVRRAAPSKGAT
jgi:peptidoglycan/LPS O-acetylase OafA/YrhL